jgi:hypothetical protein
MADKKFSDFTLVNVPSTINLDNDFLVGNKPSLAINARDTKYPFGVLKRLYDSGIGQDQTGTPVTGSTSLAITSIANFVMVKLSGNWNPASITGLEDGKEIDFLVFTNGLNGYPWQINFPSNIFLPEGIEPTLLNNIDSADNFDIIKLRGLSGNRAILLDVSSYDQA